MTIPKELSSIFHVFLTEYSGATDLTSDRERSLARGRYELHDHVVLTLSHPSSNSFTVRVVPEDYQEQLEESWKTYFITLTREVKEGKDASD